MVHLRHYFVTYLRSTVDFSADTTLRRAPENYNFINSDSTLKFKINFARAGQKQHMNNLTRFLFLFAGGRVIRENNFQGLWEPNDKYYTCNRNRLISYIY